MADEARILDVDGVALDLRVVRKRVKNINARLRGKTLLVSAPHRVSARELEEPILTLARRLVRRMLAEAADYLTEDGVLVIEVGNSMVHVMAEWPEVDFEWVKFRHGGHGVFVLSAEQCRHFQSLFAESL